MKRTFNLGSINLNGTGKRYPVKVNVELKSRGGERVFRLEDGERVYTGETTPEYVEFTASASASAGACIAGQCLDRINAHRLDFTEDNRETWDDIYKYWKQYHLNGLNAGTPEQTAAVDEWLDQGNRYDYTRVCNMLEEKGLYEVLYTGKTVGRMYNNEPYKYGHGWIVRDIPGDDLIKIEHLLSVE